ncbi:MAG: hypothetical protein IJW29_06355 [Clostridia bacterium]|nr:hypothetical protein [Clostridia bacterium]
MEILGTKTFVIEPDPTMQAFKVCEEAFELFQAAKHRNDTNEYITADRRRWDMIDECADVIQAALNFFDAIGLTEEEVLDAMDECYSRNRFRGRVE